MSFEIQIKRECEICKKIYDGYFRTLYIKDKFGKKCVCLECRENLRKGKIYFTNHIPSFCDGGDLITQIFDNEQELLEFVKKNTKENFIATISNCSIITDVCKTKKYWWVRGYVNLNLDLPDFNETIKKLNYK